MSWSIHFTSPNTDEFLSIGDAAIKDSIARGIVPPEQAKLGGYAMHNALKAAKLVAESTVVGGAHKTLAITISGHANPDHEPQDGWVNDYVTIQVTQLMDTADMATPEEQGLTTEP